MMRTILILTALAIGITLATHYTGGPVAPNTAVASAGGAAPAQTAADSVAAAAVIKTDPGQPARRERHSEATVSNQSSAGPSPTSPEAIAFAAAIDTLTSPHSTYSEKQAAWKQLQDSGRLADAAAELEKLKAADPTNALYPAALGQAYLKLCATSTDVRAQGIWAMTADTDFEAALNLDPSNWDARFTRAMAMSYWPDNLNKGGEVIQQFNLLIQQQEQQAPQPQFAQTYEWLGKQYQKTGQTDAAQQIWQRGATLYPNNQSLQSLLAAGPPLQQ
jgi:hypothetical protein